MTYIEAGNQVQSTDLESRVLDGKMYAKRYLEKEKLAYMA